MSFRKKNDGRTTCIVQKLSFIQWMNDFLEKNFFKNKRIFTEWTIFKQLLKKTTDFLTKLVVHERKKNEMIKSRTRPSLEIISNNPQHNIFYKQLGKLHITFFIKKCNFQQARSPCNCMPRAMFRTYVRTSGLHFRSNILRRTCKLLIWSE